MTTPTPSPQSGLTAEAEPEATPVAPVPALIPAPAVSEAKDDKASAPAAPEVSTPGGLPGIPALTIGAGSTVTAVSTAGMLAGPVSAVLMAGGLAATGAAVAVVRATRRTERPRTLAPRTPRQRSGGGGGQRAASGGLGVRSRFGGGAGGGGARRAGGALRSAAASGIRAARAAQTRAGQIRSARTGADRSGPRRGRREQLTADRRRVADARRDRKAAQRHSAASGAASGPRKGMGAGGTAKGGLRGLAGALSRRSGGRHGKSNGAGTTAKRAGGLFGRRGAAGGSKPPRLERRRTRREGRRQARDEIRGGWVKAERARIQKRAAERMRKRALRRAAGRFHARKALAALCAAPLGLLSMALWPLCKLLRIPAPQWGRRLYRHMVRAAMDDRLQREIAAHDKHDQDQAAEADATRAPLGPVDNGDTTTAATITTTKGPDMSTSAFDFREAAEAMLQQAQQAEPGGMMSVLAAFEGLPEAMQSIAETMAVVATKASDEMPLDPKVGDAIADLHKHLLAAVGVAEQVSETFRAAHESDIRRHEDPRVAEHQWDTNAND